MKPNNQTISDHEIDLKELILTIWKEKYLILIFSLIFSVLGYIYGTHQSKVFQATATLREAPEYVFERFQPYQLENQNQSLSSKNFNKEFKYKLQSLSNIIKFVEQNEKLNEFKSFINKSGINIDSYFKGKSRIKYIKEEDTFIYTLNFSKPLPGPQFLNDYIIFTFQMTSDFIKKEQIKNITYKIKTLKPYIENAKTQLENLSGRSDALNESYMFFLKNYDYFSQELISLEGRLSEMKDFSIDYNPIVSKSSAVKQISKSNFYFMTVGFVIGLIFLILTLIIRKIVRE